MKLISKLAVAFLFVVTLVSCSKDEEQPTVEQPSLVGKWTFEKQAGFYDVAEDPSKYVDYKHGCSTTKDFRIFSADTKVSETYYWNGCDQPYTRENYKWGWKEAGKKIFIENVDSKRGDVYEVLQLDAATLKLKWVEHYGAVLAQKDANKAVSYNYFIFKRG